MNLKKIFAGALSLAMALSTVNFSYAEPTGEFVDVGGTFVSDTAGYYARNEQPATVSYSKEQNHANDETGALKVAADTMKDNSTVIIIKKDLDSSKIEEGEAYRLTAYVYAQSRAVAEDKTSSVAYIGVDNDDWGSMWNCVTGSYISKEPYTTACSLATELKQGEWTKVSVDFIGNKDLKFLKLVFGQVQAKTDVYYIDDVTIEKRSNADDFFNSLSSGPVKRYSKTNTVDFAFSNFDVSETKNVLTAGDETDLIAYLQDNSKKTAKDVLETRTNLDLNNLTAETSDRDVAVYENGKIKAISTGNAVITFTYNNNGTKITSKLFVTVHPGNENSFVFNGKGTNYYKVTDPMNSNREVSLSYGSTLNTTIPSNKPTVTSFRMYYSGLKAKPDSSTNRWRGYAIGRMGTIFNGTSQSAIVYGDEYNDRGALIYTKFDYVNSDEKQVTIPSGNVKEKNAVNDSVNLINAGWNNIDIVTSYPSVGSYEDGYMSIEMYVNGNKIPYSGNNFNIKELKMDGTKTVGFWTFKDDSVYSLIDDLTIVSMNEDFKVSGTVPAVGEKLSTLDDIDVKFNSQAKVSDIENCATLYCGDEAVETVKVMSTDNKRLSVIPQGGLKPNTKYTLKLAADKFTDTLGATLTGTNEFTFTTNNVKVSDVIGSGYKLLNSQLDMIANGNYTLSSATSEKLADNILHASAISKKQGTAFSIAADAKFTTDSIKADKVVVEFDTKTDAVYNEGREPLRQCERWVVNAKDAKDNSSQISAIGGADYWTTNFFANYYKFMLDEKGNRVADGRDGKYKLYTYTKDNQTQTLISDPIVDRYFNIYNKGYVHVKIEYDLNNGNKEGDVTQTVTLTMEDDTVYKKTLPATAMVNGYPDVTAITSLNVIMHQLEVDIDEKTNLGAFASRDVYLKNVNMYALQNDPDSIPDAEILGVKVFDDGGDSITSAADLNDKYIGVTAAFKNNKLGDDAAYVIVAAAYDKATNKLIDVVIGKPGTVSNGITSEAEDLALDLLGFKGAAEIRVFAWNSLEGAMPLTEVNKPF